MFGSKADARSQRGHRTATGAENFPTFQVETLQGSGHPVSMAPRFNNIPPELLRASSGWRNDKRFGPARSELESLLYISLQRRRPLYTSRRPARTDWETTSRGGFAHSDSDVVDGEATLRHELLQIAVREGIP